MKKPTKPRKPTAPKEPAKNLEWVYTITLYDFDGPLDGLEARILAEIEKQKGTFAFADDITLKGVGDIYCSTDYDYSAEINVDLRCSRPNPDYDKEVEDYDKKLAKYDERWDLYKVAMLDYEVLLTSWEEWEQGKEHEELQKKKKALEKKLAEVDEKLS